MFGVIMVLTNVLIFSADSAKSNIGKEIKKSTSCSDLDVFNDVSVSEVSGRRTLADSLKTQSTDEKNFVTPWSLPKSLESDWFDSTRSSVESYVPKDILTD